jgi:hypothetical protein
VSRIVSSPAGPRAGIVGADASHRIAAFLDRPLKPEFAALLG